MPFQDVIQNHITTAQAKQTETLIQQLQTLLQPHLRLLDEEKNNKYGAINEQNILFAHKVMDYRDSRPAIKF